MDLKALAAGERRDLADFLETLSPQQWEMSSLCERWTVREVVAHVISYDELSTIGLVRRFVGGRFVPDRVNAVGVAEYRHQETDELVRLLREHAVPRGLTAGFGGGIALTDGLIHHQDIRRALDTPRRVPQERLAEVLPFALRAPTIPGRKLSRGLTLRATDLDWSAGTGPEVAGPGEALLMAVAGRPAALSDLTGDGTSILARRLA